MAMAQNRNEYTSNVSRKNGDSTQLPNMNINSLVALYESQIQKNNMNVLDHIEFEVRFGSKKYSVTKRHFENTFKTLIQNNFEKSFDDYMLRLSFEDIPSLRCEIDSLKDIKTYCGSENIADVPHRFVSKDNLDGVENLYFNEDMNFRVSMKREQEINENDSRVRIVVNSVDNITSNLRYIQRTSMTCSKLPNIRVDLSMVQKNKKRSTVFQDLVSDKIKDYYYEIEIELINVDKKSFDQDSISKQLKQTIKFIMSGIQETNFPISYPKQESVLLNYLKLFGVNDFDFNNPRNKITRYFIGPSSMTLQVENVIKDESSSDINIQDGFCVTDKADGERKLLFINDDYKLYLINTNMQVQYTGIRLNKDSTFANTLFDGEHILYDKDNNYINLYAAFDIYFLRNKDYREFPFIRRKKSDVEDKGKVIARYKILDILLNNERSISKFFNYESKNKYYHMKLHLKDFKEGISNVSGKSIFDACKFIIEKQELGNFPYNTDGLIFTSSHLGVGLTPTDSELKNHIHTWDHSFKWKPPEYNTIDFLVEVEKSKNTRNVNIDSKVLPDSRIVQYKTLLLKVGFSEGQKGHGYVNPQQSMLDMKLKQSNYTNGKYKAEYFYPTAPYDPEAHICHMELKPDSSGDLKMFTDENEVIEDDTIIEFKYEKENEDKFSRWVPLRIRHDKTNEYKKYRNKFGNAYHVANSNWHSIHHPVTVELLTNYNEYLQNNKIEEKYDDGVYYDRNGGESMTKQLRNFHNKIVKKILFKLVNKSDKTSIIDFAVGKGGDIPKWIDLKFHSVLGIDISEDNIHNRFDGACARYLNMNNSKRKTPICMFIKGDSSKLLDNGEFAYDNKTRDIYDALLGNGKRTKNMSEFLYKNYGIFKNKFDVGSIQFAIHYMFESKETLHKFLRNVALHVKSGGYFIGTCYDGQKVFNMLKDVDYNEKKELYINTRKIWHIQKKYNDTEDNELNADDSCIGLKINVYQESINRDFDEYLVNFEYFIKVMKDYGFTPNPDIKSSKGGKPMPSIGNFQIFNDKFNKEFKMTAEEKQISYLNNYFIFQNTGNLSFESVKRTYNYYMGVESDESNDDIGFAENLNVKVELK